MASLTVGRLNVFLNAKIGGFTKGLDRVERRLNRMSRQIKGVGSTLSRNFTLPILAAGGAVTKATADWETSLVNIAKTVDATDAEIQALGRSLMGLSEQIPVSAAELAAIASEAGQLGVATRNILGFTKTVAALRVATNLGEDAGSSLARLANITGTAQTEFDRIGATIVALGNNSAATEAEITDMSLRIAAAGRQIGQSAAQSIGWAAALSSLGIQAEAGGTAISRVFSDIATAVSTGGTRLEQFAQIAGMSVAEFRQAFAEDGGGAVLTFIEGLARMGDEGHNLFGVLEEVGFGNVRVRDTLLRASGATELLRNSLELGVQAWEENTALTDEAGQFYNRLAGRIQILWNRLKNITTVLGDAFRPAIERVLQLGNKLLNIMHGLVQRFAALSPQLREQIGLWAAVVAAIGPVLVGFGVVIALFGKVVAVIAGVVSGFGVLVAGIIAIKNNWLGMGDAAASAWGLILTVAPRVLETIGNVVRPVINFIIGALRSLGAVAVIVFNEFIRDPVVSAFKTIKEWAEPVLSAVAKGFELIGKLGQGAADAIKGFFADAAEGAEEEGATLGSRIAAAVANAFGTDYVGTFVGIIRTGIDRARELIQRAIAALRSMAGGGGFAAELEAVDTELGDIQAGISDLGSKGARDLRPLATTLDGIASSFSDTIADAITGAGATLKDFVKSAIADLARLAARFAVFKMVTSGFGLAAGGFFGSSFLGFSLPGRAMGGPVVSGQPYVVGERGPELFVPRSSGTVVPNHALQQQNPVVFDFSSFPAARSPLEAARDAEWQRFLRESALSAMSDGFRFQGA